MIPIFGLKKIDEKYLMDRYAESQKVKDLLWCTKFKEARIECESGLSNGFNIWTLRSKAETNLWIYFADQSDENFDIAQQTMKDTQDIAQYYLEESKEPFFSFFSGEHALGKMRRVIETHATMVSAFATLGGSVLEFRKKEYISGGWHLRSAWKTFQLAREMQLHPDYPIKDDVVLNDLLVFALGFFSLAISLIPPAFLWFAEMIGFKADRNDGIEKLQSVFEKRSMSYIESGLLLSMIRFFFLDDPDGAIAVARKLHEEKPSSVYLSQSLATMVRFKGGEEAIKEAIHLCEHAYKCSEEYPQMKLSQGYILGDLYFLIGEYEKAIPLFRDYLNYTNRENFRAYCGFRLGFALQMVDVGQNPNEITEVYRNVIEKWARDSESFDRYSKRKCQEYLDR